MRESEERYRTLFTAAPMAVFLCDRDAVIQHYNQRAVELWGREPKCGVEQYCGSAKLWLPDGTLLPHAQSPIAEVLRTGIAALNVEVFIERPDGSRVPVLVNIAALNDVQGDITGAIVSFVDITERKQAEEERARLLTREQAARLDAETANRAKDEFLATVSHELRSPLNAMLGWAQLLSAGKLDTANSAKAFETIHRNARSQAKLIEDLLEVSRIITGKLRLEFQPVQLAQVIERALDVVRPAAEAKEVQLESEIDAATGLISGDPDRLQQVVWNLLSNAIKFTPKGGRVEIRLGRAEGAVQISVRDTGPGISAEFLPYAFDRFRQADSSARRSHGGLGLGLAIVRHLVEMHGGTARAESPGEGQGTTFTVKLPIRAVQQISREAAIGQRMADKVIPFVNPAALADVRVLVVDDEADARELLTTVLAQYAANTMAVGSTAAALETLERWQPNVLVCDIGMPVEDGYDLIRRVRAREPERGGSIPAIALTAYARAEDRARAVAAGYQAHIAKPVETTQLVSIVADLVGRAS